jgi:hypothetical protein
MVRPRYLFHREQREFRPVLIVSPAEFNEATKLPVVLPITNGGERTMAEKQKGCRRAEKGGNESENHLSTIFEPQFDQG